MIRTILQLVLVDETGDSYYRMRWPGAELARRDPNLRIINLDAQARERIHLAIEADLLVLIQNSDLDLLPVIEERRRQGKKTLIEYNDNFYEPPAWSPVAEPWSSPLIWQNYEILMRAADSMMVTGPGLAELFRSRTSAPIHIIENDFPRDLPPYVAPPSREEIRIGWAGSLGHMADLLAIQPVFLTLLQEFPNLKISLMGNESIPEVLKLPAERIEFTPWGGMQDYLNFLMKVQIGIAPMLDTGYNRCRSDIKAIEMVATGTLPVLQRTLPYEKFIRETGAPSFSSNQELLETLRKLIADESARLALTERAYNYVRTSRTNSARNERLELYRSLYENVPPSAFNWPLPPGYHEVKGTTDQEAFSAKLLKDLQELVNRGEREQAVTRLREIVGSNPGHPDLQLALFKLTLRTDRAKAEDRAPLLRRQFPRDLRFLITLIGIQDSRTRLPILIEELAAALGSLPERSKEVFRREITSVLKNLAKKELVTGAELNLISSNFKRNPELKLLVAERLEREGKPGMAAVVYEEITEEFLIAESHANFKNNASFGFLRAWAEGLKGREK